MTPSANAPPTTTPSNRSLGRLCLAAVLLAALGACAPTSRDGRPLTYQLALVGCFDRCQKGKDQCDVDARFDYQQCQAGYQSAQRDFRWCNASSEERCGYPWWSCSENLYGFCSNRYQDCRRACESQDQIGQ